MSAEQKYACFLQCFSAAEFSIRLLIVATYLPENSLKNFDLDTVTLTYDL